MLSALRLILWTGRKFNGVVYNLWLVVIYKNSGAATDTAPNHTVSPFTLSCFIHLVFLFFFYLNLYYGCVCQPFNKREMTMMMMHKCCRLEAVRLKIKDVTCGWRPCVARLDHASAWGWSDLRAGLACRYTQALAQAVGLNRCLEKSHVVIWEQSTVLGLIRQCHLHPCTSLT